MIAAVLPHASSGKASSSERLAEVSNSRRGILVGLHVAILLSGPVASGRRRLRGVEKDTKLVELSAEGTTSLELFASNFVPDGQL
ncbi:hypothetical protein AB3X91_06415 [Paraburkholderia sp. BR14263]|uniref:hypothetical protein n=1 Tax=unclassified Paraburkholderia TaxID=2615204 RepID=UPI0034CFB194